MLLSSLAWFTSLLCLGLMICSCCFKACRRYALSSGGDGGGGSSSRGRRGRGGGAGGGRDRGGGYDTCSPGRSPGSGSRMMSFNGNGTAATTPTKEVLHWQANGGGSSGSSGSNGGGDGICWEAASMAERVRGGDEEEYSPGVVSRF